MVRVGVIEIVRIVIVVIVEIDGLVVVVVVVEISGVIVVRGFGFVEFFSRDEYDSFE